MIKKLTLLIAMLMASSAWSQYDIGVKCSDEELNVKDANFVEKWILINRQDEKVRLFHVETYKWNPFIFRDNTYDVTENVDYYYWTDLDPSKYTGRRYKADGSWEDEWLRFVTRSNDWKLDRETLVLDGRMPCKLSTPGQVKSEIDSVLKEKKRKEKEKKLEKEQQDLEQVKKNKI